MRPGEGKEPFGFHLLHEGLPFHVLVTGIGHLAPRDLTGHERAVQFHAKPLAEFAVIGERAPDPRNRRLEFDTLFNLLHTVSHVTQSSGCILMRADWKCNLFVALLAAGGLSLPSRASGVKTPEA